MSDSEQIANTVDAPVRLRWMHENRGRRFYRTQVPPDDFFPGHINRERVFSERWAAENEPRHWLNFGHGILQDLFIDGDMLWQRKISHRITRRDRMIVATVIQWLGSNCGWCFLEQCIRACGYRLVKDEQSNKD